MAGGEVILGASVDSCAPCGRTTLDQRHNAGANQLLLIIPALTDVAGEGHQVIACTPLMFAIIAYAASP